MLESLRATRGSVQELALGSLDSGEQAELAKAFLEHVDKEITSDHLTAVLEFPGCQSPLYLRTLLQVHRYTVDGPWADCLEWECVRLRVEVGTIDRVQV